MSTASRRDDAPELYCVELRTAGWEQSVEWYRQALGLRVLVRVTDDQYALLSAGETRLAILARSSPGEPTRRISLAFEVRDLWTAVTRLQAAGAAIEYPKPDAEGLREITVSDPDGNRIRLFAWPRGR